jgi:hypothetical protein
MRLGREEPWIEVEGPGFAPPDGVVPLVARIEQDVELFRDDDGGTRTATWLRSRIQASPAAWQWLTLDEAPTDNSSDVVDSSALDQT